jgi:hypothetical protein
MGQARRCQLRIWFRGRYGTLFQPVQVLASAYADAIKAQQQAWAVLIDAARGTRESTRS